MCIRDSPMIVQGGTIKLKSSTRRNGDGSCSTRSCRSSAGHPESGKHKQQTVIFTGCNKLVDTACRSVASGIRLVRYVLLRNIATPPPVLMFGVAHQRKDLYPHILKVFVASNVFSAGTPLYPIVCLASTIFSLQ